MKVLIFDINKYPGNVAMHCTTEQEAREFCDLMIKDGRYWASNESYNDTKWDWYKKNTCYNFNCNMYCDLDYFKEENFLILEWSDFFNTKLNICSTCNSKDCEGCGFKEG